MLRKNIFALMAIGCLTALVACNDYETYGDKKDKERELISQFISDSSIVVIDESEFHANGDITDTQKNEFVYLNNSGVYMQIVHKGVGTPLKDGENTMLIMRFKEMCLEDTTVLDNLERAYDPDFLKVKRSGTTYTASYVQNLSLMYSAYSSTSVPPGLLVAFPYINVGRARTENDQISKVRLIVPHSQGHTIASSYVYPYYYELSFQRVKDL